MASTLSYPNYLHSHLQYRHLLLQIHRHNQKRNLRIHNFSRRCSGQLKIVGRNGALSFRCLCKTKTESEKVPVENNQLEEERPPFDINLAVILAGFAFEAYTSSPENVRSCEIDASGCKTIYLSESFVREIYDGQLFIKLKRGFDLPAMDPWGTSDPYVVMQLDGQVVKSKTKWGKKEPTWNEDFNFNVKLSPTKNIQVAAWDANLVTPHKRMGNTSISLELLCDGDMHGVLVELEGMGGGGKLEFEVKYKSFEEIDEEKKWWEIPFISELLRKNGFDSALKMFAGSESIPARQFVEYAFGQLKSFNDAYLRKDQLLNGIRGAEGVEVSNDPNVAKNISLKMENGSGNRSDDSNFSDKFLEEFHLDNAQSNKQFWKNFADTMNQNVVQKLGISVPEKLKWDGFDMLNNIGLQAQKIAESGYIESGLATSEGQESDTGKSSTSLSVNTVQSSLPDIRKVKQDLLRQTESVLGALMVLTAAVSQLNKGIKNEATEDSSTKMESTISKYIGNQNLPSSVDSSELEEKVTEEMKALFSSAESAMEAWAMLATSLGHPSFIKSEFEKICFLDNETTDTQVALWRDLTRKRLVVAFRGTEQAKWKDLLTDLMMVPAGLNPERIGGDFKQEIQVHSGFLSAYDSVHIRIISLIKQAIGYVDEIAEPVDKWQIYVTGHSLGGALATLLALELSSSQLAKRQLISVTMYNFGSPRVGNRRFADIYNEKVKDSWRVVNHRDIIPTVPRLMGYCHVAQPIYLAGGGLRDALETLEVWKDGYQGDVIGEYTPDVLVGEVMKGEKELIEKILQTEINIFRAIRDGSALMQHMEDFYYISLLESVRSNYQTGARSETGDDDTISIS